MKVNFGVEASVSDAVYTALRVLPETRGDDMKLLSAIIRRLNHKLSEQDKRTLCRILDNWDYYSDGINFDTISRTRQRIQHKTPELRPSENVIKRRREREKRFRTNV